MAEHRNKPETSSTYLFPAEESLIQRLLYAPGISWQMLRIVVAFGSLGFFLVILFFT